jgi:septal ring factor EnvC (AmiA/AmiB activator)
MALARYGITMHKRFNMLKSSFNSINTEKSKISEDLRAAELDCHKLREQVQDLKAMEAKYRTWKQREPEIRHYLDSFSSLSR